MLVATLMKRLLSEAGYTVHSAGNGREALDLVHRENLSFELLLTDVVMPDMKGPELARVLQAENPDLCVLYASGYTDDALMESGTLERGVDLISKPFTRTDLLKRVRGVLQKNVG